MLRYKLIITSKAVSQIQGTVDYYNSVKWQLGKQFFADVNKQIKSIKSIPYSRAIRYDEIRLALLDKFPFAIHYSVTQSQITIYAVMSTLQNPETTWIVGR